MGFVDDLAGEVMEVGAGQGVGVPPRVEGVEVPRGRAALGAGGRLPAVVDDVIKGVATDDGTLGSRVVSEHPHQNQVGLLAVLLGTRRCRSTERFCSSPAESRK